MQQNLKSKSQLAKMLAQENIVVVHQVTKTARFDMTSRILTLPIWDKMEPEIYDMLIIHEVGHALETPKEWLDAINRIVIAVTGHKVQRHWVIAKDWLNVVEDVRIEKLQKRRYPGSRRDFIEGYKLFLARNFFGTRDRAIASMNFIDRINIHFKCGSGALVPFSAKEQIWIKRIEAIETWDETVEITEQLFREEFRKLASKRTRTLSATERKSLLEELEKLLPKEEKKEKKEREPQEDINDYHEKVDLDFDDKEEEIIEVGDDDAEEIDIWDVDPDDITFLTPVTPAELSSNIEKLGREDMSYTYIQTPEPNLSYIVDDFPKVLGEHNNAIVKFSPQYRADLMSSMNDWKLKETNTLSFLVKEFETRKAADRYARQSISKTGRLDTGKLHQYKFNEDLFKKLTIVPDSKSHGFVMFVDWSSSMIPHLANTLKQTFSLALFCRRVQIPFEVYLFKNGIDSKSWNLDPKVKYLGMGGVKLRNILSGRMNANQFTAAMRNMWTFTSSGSPLLSIDVLGGTPLDSAIVAAEKIVNSFKIKNKLQVVNTIFLTDGASDWSSFPEREGGWSLRTTNRFILRDPISHKTIPMNTNNEKVTNTLLEQLKNRTGTNLIGFYIFPGRYKNMYDNFAKYLGTGGDQKKILDLKAFWSENQFVPVKGAGYDEYYVIDGTRLKPQASEFTKTLTEEKMSARQVAKAFAKFSNKQTVNRVLLKRFIDLVVK